MASRVFPLVQEYYDKELAFNSNNGCSLELEGPFIKFIFNGDQLQNREVRSSDSKLELLHAVSSDVCSREMKIPATKAAKSRNQATLEQIYQVLDIPKGSKLSLSVELVEARTTDESFRLYCAYQTAIHKDPNPFSEDNDDDIAAKNNDEETINTSSSGDQESDGSESESYKNRHNSDSQSDLHEDMLAFASIYSDKAMKSLKSYKRFLVSSPLETKAMHMNYRINGKLVGVGVLDVPRGKANVVTRLDHVKVDEDHNQNRTQQSSLLGLVVSSVYAYFDPRLPLLNIGKITALYEILLTKKLQSNMKCIDSSSRYYYLGYYIHSCTKMKYKASYKPSELRNVKQQEWVDYEEAKTLLEAHPLHDFVSNSNNMKNVNINTQSIIQRIPLDVGANHLVFIGMLTEQGRQLVMPLLQELASFFTKSNDTSSLLPRLIVKLR